VNWTSDYGTQRACRKGVGASGPKGLKPMYYSILRGYFITVAFQLYFWMTFRRSKYTRRDWNWVGHFGFWSLFMMLIYLVQTDTLFWKTETLLVARKGVGPKVIAESTKYMLCLVSGTQDKNW